MQSRKREDKIVLIFIKEDNIIKEDYIYKQIIGEMKCTSIFQQALLDSILPSVKKTQKWNKNLNQLSKITTISFIFIINNSSKITKTTSETKGKCPQCPKCIPNNLLFLLHLEMIHKNEMDITKYQISHELMTIHYKKRLESTQNMFLEEGDKGGYMLKGKHSSRVMSIMQDIFSKFVKKSDATRKQYFHSADIFREVGEQSEDEDSEAEIGKIERQLQKLRISEFTDVNDSDKLFFVTWNSAIYEAKKTCKLIDHDEMVNILNKFAVTAKKLSIKRMSLVMHAWTLWSAGKISSIDVTTCINAYDTAVTPPP